ncbi:hypothetical protein [Rhodanobacter sp. A1T4]|uniref:hypothetical protein n=1 Tax=Rhodanobacter sp. A1T4 TaxID=2723087 RepID=UPI001611E291|nr:hypothetical protein [Rhodanobacter sp. A1T4]MBB6246326.1 putative membrane protein YgcG [Rhodanobacter sp. A1T4]
MKKLIVRWAICFLLIGNASALGGGGKGLSIQTTLPIYKNLSNVVGTDNSSDETIQTAGATQVAAVYRLSVAEGLPAGATFRIVWQDGSSESILVASTTSSLGAVPIPGSQKAAGASGGSGSGSGTGGSNGGGSGSDSPTQTFPEANGSWACTSSDSGGTWNCTWFPDATTGA